ncbi:MAG TPA: glycosyltransferase [Burkholderiales bacterium]|nr:glycosyltransferase [Burkholderiales bacterium]
MKRVFFHVQHLLGIGHLKRAVVLCRALAAAGFDVTLASGGAPVPALSFPGKRVQLPPMAAADAAFKTFVDEAGRPIGEAWKERRKEMLLEAWRAAGADVLIVELFPFGRRQLRFELLPLLEAARGALVICSVRDILQKRPEREAAAVGLIEAHFHKVLVHGDPDIAPFEMSFSAAAQLADRLFYTGYVVEEAPVAGDAGRGEVLVSAGGGAVGRRLLETALVARPLTRLRDRTWRLLGGINASLEGVEPRSGVIIERARIDFATLLRNCELSVSQAGYNTLLETLQARTRAVVVPFSQGSETEQGMRARLFADRGLVAVLEERDLSPAALAAAVDEAMARPRPQASDIDLDGASRSAELVARWVA